MAVVGCWHLLGCLLTVVDCWHLLGCLFAVVDCRQLFGRLLAVVNGWQLFCRLLFSRVLAVVIAVNRLLIGAVRVGHEDSLKLIVVEVW